MCLCELDTRASDSETEKYWFIFPFCSCWCLKTNILKEFIAGGACYRGWILIISSACKSATLSFLSTQT